jgi:hypothetical protein
VTLSAPLVEPAFRSSPEYSSTFGPEVADLCDLVGFGPDPQQRLGLDLVYSRSGGRHAAMSATIVAPRQNLKTGLLKQKALGDLYLMEEPYIVWSAHIFDTARRAFMELKQLIEGSEYLSRRTDRIYEGTGTEAIVTTTGGRLEFKARTNTGSRGLAVPNLFMDEAFSLKAPAMASLLPLILAQPDPQVIYASSAGLSDSDFLRSQRDRGRAGDPTMTYLEWCDDLPGECQQRDCEHQWGKVVGCRMDDVARWYRAMPALGGRVTIEAVQLLRRDLSAEDFARECLGDWDDPGSVGRPIDPAAWQALEDSASTAKTVAAFGVEVSLDRAFSAIAVGGPRGDGRVHVELVPTVRGGSEFVGRGSGWVVARCVELDAAQGPAVWAVDGGGEAAALVDELEKAGLKVVRMSSGDRAAASSGLAEAVKDKTVSPHGPRPELVAAVEGAKKKPLDDGKFTFSRRVSTVDITALLAVRNAHWATDLGYNVLDSIW